jgi:hypothetical protein
MRRLVFLAPLVLLGCGIGPSSSPQAVPARSLSGAWNWTATGANNQIVISGRLTDQDAVITGTVTAIDNNPALPSGDCIVTDDATPITGTVSKQGIVSLSASLDTIGNGPAVLEVNAQLSSDGKSMQGSYALSVRSACSNNASGNLTGQLQKEKLE